MFEPIKTRRAFEEVVEQICDAIASGAIKVGEKLPPERALALQMHVSRPTIREALSVLSESGTLEIVRGRGGGAVVRTNMIDPGLRERTADLHFTEVSGLLVARRMLEPKVAALAVVHATEADLRELERRIEVQQEATGDRERFLRADLQFHTQIARSTGNSTVIELMSTLLSRLAIAYDMALREDSEMLWTRAVDEHTRIVQAISSRDPDEAELQAAHHMTILEDMWTELTGHGVHRKLPSFLLPIESWYASDGGAETPSEPVGST